ncbi:MAG TPA: PA14 domain-containing protein [Terriglobia bacterium]|nr:PA14 domain-containing protein [Terriglobia bacterium]
MKRIILLLPGILLTFVTTAATAAERLEPGLTGEYFQMEGSLDDFPKIEASRKPSLQRVDKEINFESTLEAFPGTKLMDNFYVRWTGLLKIAKDGRYKFFLNSDDGSRLFIDGKQVVDNGGTHDMSETSGEAELKAGNHEIKVEFFDAEEDAGCILSWETAGVAKAVVPASVLFHKAAGGEPGLVAEYFNTEEGAEDFPDFPASKAPDLKRVDKDINFASTQDDWPGTHFKDFFYIRWTGTIRIPEAGAYTFYLESDDGSRMFIDGKQVLDNGGAHAMEEVSGSMNLTAGDHVLKVEFFEKDIDAGCKMSWKGPKLEKQIVPASVLFH